MQKPVIFVSSSMEGLGVARELAQQLESAASPMIWTEAAFHPGRTVAESLTEAVDRCDFAVVVLTTDDVVARNPRSNLLFELGFLSGRLGLDRTLIVVDDTGRTAIPSDLTGVNYLRVHVTKRGNVASAIAPVAAAIVKVVRSLGVRQSRAEDKLFSYFISYAWKDKEFAAQLHDDLSQVGVRSWLDVKEIRVGDSISEQIQKGIQASDKLLLILSESSIHSPWVRQELKHAVALEKARGQSVLFPIRIDDAVFSSSPTDDLVTLRERFIADFSKWQNQDEYRRAFSRLVRDLTITASAESGRYE